jgi:hypothetical protein
MTTLIAFTALLDLSSQAEGKGLYPNGLIGHEG